MNILLCSHSFAPSIGGIETVSGILADQFRRLGSTVTVVTNTQGEPASENYEIVRCPSSKRLRQLARESDIVFQNNISLKTLFPLLLLPTPKVIAHHTWITRTNGKRGWQDYLKLAVLPLCRNVAISNAIAAALPVRSFVVGNPFESGEFTQFNKAPRTKDIVFLGRLVSDKGCDLALHSLALLKQEGITPSFSVIGDGPELAALKHLAKELGVTNQLEFLGALREGRGEEVARHKIMVIPSRWAEPFGIVALEGLAAGCAVVASSAGGLPEAIGPCGILFQNGDALGLASALKRLLSDDSLRESFTKKSAQHLDRFQPENVARRYLDIFRLAVSDKSNS